MQYNSAVFRTIERLLLATKVCPNRKNFVLYDIQWLLSEWLEGSVWLADRSLAIAQVRDGPSFLLRVACNAEIHLVRKR